MLHFLIGFLGVILGAATVTLFAFIVVMAIVWAVFGNRIPNLKPQPATRRKR